MKKVYTFIIAVFIAIQLLNAQPTSQTFNSSGTYTVPAGFSALVVIEAWGAGGGGGTNSGNAKGGGGGGAYASLTTTLTAGGYAVTVGTGGGAATAGGASSFTTIVVAAGGSSTTTTTGGAGGTVAASTGTIKFAGGAGGAGASSTGVRGGGGGGGSATASATGGIGGNGLAGAPGTGGIGGTGTGAGGAGADDDGTPDAVPGTAPGGGGGGRGNAGNSAAGANGRVVVTVTTILPVRLSSFSATKKNSSVQLQWNAETESNLSGYTIERSYDGSNFSAITVVPSQNSSMAASYNYTDAIANANVIYYRIAINELDGKATFSRIIKVISGGSANLLVYPNPVRGGVVSFVTPDMVKGKYSIKIFNSNAQIVYQMSYTHSGGSLSQQFQLPASLKPGLYSMQISDNQVKYMHSFLLQ